MSLSPTVLWAILGLVLILAELLTLSFVLIFFGIAALLVSLVKAFGLNHLSAEIFLFALLGLSGIFLFRKKLLANCATRDKMSIDENQKIILSHDLTAKGTARITYQGTQWTAHNESDQHLNKGATVFLVKTEGIHLYVDVVPNQPKEE